ncbi:MAG: tetratricopeptide repeat protein [Acidobacteria bacterium]|nr:tetratricopeptide repeat protein [Acidobacteriota bacterium]
MKKGIFLILIFLALLLLFGKVVFYFKNQNQFKSQKISQKANKKTDSGVNNQSQSVPQETAEKKTAHTKPQIQEANELPLSIESISVVPYEGKFADFMPLLKANSSVETSIQTSVKILQEKSGLFPTKADKISIFLTDSKNITKGYPYDIEEKEDGSFAIALSLQTVLYNALPIHELTASALAESLLQKRNHSFLKFPRFFRFGFAAYLSGLDEYLEKQEILKIEKEGAKIEFSVFSQTSHPALNGIYLTKFVINNSEEESPKAIISQIGQESDFSTFLEKITKFSFQEIEQNYIKYSKNRYAGLTSLSNFFYSIVGQLRNLKEDSALPALKEFIRTNPTDIHFGEGFYYLGYANYRLGNYPEAEKIFGDLLINHSFKTISQGKAHLFLGKCYQLRGYPSLAVPEYRYALLGEDELLRKVANKRIEEITK